ncbi:MAG: M64 family metallopeptidase [Rikenellaceae bacterium]
MFKILASIALCAMVVGCSSNDMEDFGGNATEGNSSRLVASTASTRVDIDGAKVTWSSDDFIYVVEIDSEKGRMYSQIFSIDASTISSDGKYAEFVGSALENGKEYRAYNCVGSGGIFSNSTYGISYCFRANYLYDSYGTESLDLLMQSESFIYDNQLSASLKFEHKSSLLELELSFEESLNFEGTIETLTISSGSQNAFLSEVVFDLNGDYVNAYLEDMQYGATNTIELSLLDDKIKLGSSTGATIKVPVTWNSAISELSSTAEFEFTLKMSDGQRAVASKPLKILEDGVRYTSEIEFPDIQEFESRDGEVITLQKATVGTGIDIVIMGDGFVEDAMGDGGEYESVMTRAMEHFFSEEPYITLRDRFNVYMVKAVSKGDGVDGVNETVFSCAFGEATLISGNSSKCFEYALKVPTISNTNDLTVITVLNAYNYAGTCVMYFNNDAAVAYCPIVFNDDEYFRQIIVHEAGGHAYAKLKDEYDYGGTITESGISYVENMKALGWGANIDITNDPEKIKWAHFLANPTYDDQVGIYEGALAYAYGVYRSTYDGIMKLNSGDYNAPSREEIYRRTMELSGDTYSYSEFLKYDIINTSSAAAAPPAQCAAHSCSDKDMVFMELAPPVVIMGTPEVYK